MATQSHVEDALANLITAALYPSSPTASVVGHPVKIYAGWPDPKTLDEDMVEAAKDGKPTAAHVSIYPLPGERNVTRYSGDRRENPLLSATYSLSAVGQVVTVGGAAPSTYRPQNLAILVNSSAYVVQALAGQTPAQIAAALQALIEADIAGVTVAGADITFPPTARLKALRVGVTGSTTREVRRQQKQFQVSVWSSHPTSRAAVADTFDPILADTPFLTLADGSQARLLYHGSREDDFIQKQRIYRRSLVFTVEYATTIVEPATQIVVAKALLFGVELVDTSGGVIFGLDFGFGDNAILTTL